MQGRDQVNLVDVAYTDEGILTGLKVKTIFNVGGVLLTHGAAPPLRVRDFATGAYRFLAHPRGGLRRLHQYQPDRAVSRGRPPGGGLPRRAGRRGGREGARTWTRSRPAAATSSSRSSSRTRRRSARSTTAATTSLRRRAPWRWPATSSFGRSSGRPASAARSWASASPRPSRSAARAREYGSVEIEPDGVDHREDRLLVARPGPRDQLRPGDRRSARRAVREDPDRPRRHRDDAARRRHRRQPQPGGRRQRALEGERAAVKPRRRSRWRRHARSLAGRPRLRARAASRSQGAPERRLELAEIAAGGGGGVGLPEGERGLKDDTDFAADGLGDPVRRQRRRRQDRAATPAASRSIG